MSTATATPPAKTEDRKMPRVIVLDNIASEGLALLENESGIEFEIHTGLAGDELKEALSKFDGAVCRSGVKITAESLEGNTRLKAIVRAGVGTDNIDKVAATRNGIVVMNTPTGNTVSTAEHTMALMLGLSRNVAPAHASLKDGKWDRKKFQGSQMFGKTLGIVGLGRIGQEVATRARAFGMNVLAFDPFLSQEQAENLCVKKYEKVADLLPEIDYLTVHTPLTPDTEGLISTKEIELIKPGCRLINCARGGIYDEAALVEGLKSGKLGGVALDVYPNEPCTDSPLFAMDGVLCTPHLGASTEEAQIQVAEEAVDLLINFLKTGEIRSAVNTISLDPQTLTAMRGHLDVAHRLGILLRQWHGGALKKCQLKFSGEVAEQDTRLLSAAFCAGLLDGVVEQASIVNAEVLCRDRGMEITRESSASHGAFASVISATVSGDGTTMTAAGTLFGKDMPRLVRLNNYRTECYLDGNLLVFTHQDVPGIIAHVGEVLATESVNIAQMAVGRTDKGPGGKAIGVLNLDSVASSDSLCKVTEHKGIETAVIINMPGASDHPSWLM